MNKSNSNVVVLNNGLAKKEELRNKLERITQEVKSNYYGSNANAGDLGP